MIAVCRPLDGITLNTEVEYLLDDEGLYQRKLQEPL